MESRGPRFFWAVAQLARNQFEGKVGFQPSFVKAYASFRGSRNGGEVDWFKA